MVFELVGVIVGKFDVIVIGFVRYFIFILVLVGIVGVQFQLNLNYNFYRKNGYLGMGWFLGGIDVIMCCVLNNYYDNLDKGGVGIDFVDYDDKDRFCLGGQCLVSINGIYGVDGVEYCIYLESYFKIIFYGNIGGVFFFFIVFKKNGDVFIYGVIIDLCFIG